MSSEPLYLVAVFKPRMGVADVVVERLRPMRDATREEPGDVYMKLVGGAGSETWCMFEKFVSREAWDVHMTQPRVTDGNVFLADNLCEPTQLRFCTEK